MILMHTDYTSEKIPLVSDIKAIAVNIILESKILNRKSFRTSDIVNIIKQLS